MWGETSKWPMILRYPALVLVVYIVLKIPWYDSYGTELWICVCEGTVCIVWRCCVVLCNPFAMRDFDIFLLFLLFAWIVKMTNKPHITLCVGLLSWGYGPTNHSP